MKSAWLPLALVWLAAHVILLGAILGLKFLTAKALRMLAMAGAALWFLARRKPIVPRLSGMV